MGLRPGHQPLMLAGRPIQEAIPLPTVSFDHRLCHQAPPGEIFPQAGREGGWIISATFRKAGEAKEKKGPGGSYDPWPPK